MEFGYAWCSWPMFACNTKLRVSAPDNTTIAAGAVAEICMSIAFLSPTARRKCYSNEKSRLAARLPRTEVTNRQVIPMCPRNSVIWLLIHSFINVLFERSNVLNNDDLVVDLYLSFLHLCSVLVSFLLPYFAFHTCLLIFKNVSISTEHDTGEVM